QGGGGGVLPAADRQPEVEQGSRLAPPRRHRADRGKRCGRDCCLGRIGRHFDRGRRPDRARAERRGPPQSPPLARASAPAEGGARPRGGVIVTRPWPLRHLGLNLCSILLVDLLWMYVSV